jgi:hypothetical protein
MWEGLDLISIQILLINKKKKKKKTRITTIINAASLVISMSQVFLTNYNLLLRYPVLPGILKVFLNTIFFVAIIC